MAANGRRTPQPEPTKGTWPRYQESVQQGLERPDVNPYFDEHRSFGRPLLPAQELWKWRDNWAELFGREGPLHLEIGSGNGFFLEGMAKQHPDWNLIAVELRYKRVVIAAKKLVKAGVHNAIVGRYDAWYLDDLFRPGCLDGIYVNHPDPWPKTRHEKNRLVSRWFLEQACTYLKPGGRLCIKSDYMDNVHRVPRLLAAQANGAPAPELPLAIVGQQDDILAHGPVWADDIETNYQRKFKLKGEPVAAIELRRL